MNKLLSIAALLALQSCIIDASPGGDRTSRSSQPDEFSGVAITGGFDHVEIIVCDDCEHEVLIQGDDRQVDEVTLTMDGDTLELGRRNRLVVTNIDLQAKIRTPRLVAFTNTSAADAELFDVRAPVFELVSSGSGNTTISGAVGVFDLVTTGSGKVRAFDLTADTVQVISSGSGGAEVCATDHLEARTTGSGNVFFDCRPEDTDFTSTGSGRVSVR